MSSRVSRRIQVQRNAELLAEPFPFQEQEDEAVRAIQQHTRPTDYVVSEEPMQVFRAGRRMPPLLCDMSAARLQTKYLTAPQAIAASHPARMVIFWGDELANLRGYRDWVRANFRLVGELNGPRGWIKEIYVRADEPRARPSYRPEALDGLPIC